MNPPPFPATEAELEPWHIYADWLLERRDPRGPLIALDLSLPSQPSSSALDRFRRSGQRLKRVHRGLREQVSLAWCLGHVRMMRVGYSATPEAVARMLADPTMQLLEEIDLLPRVEELSTPAWIEVLKALPPSCRRIVVDGTSDPLEASRLVDALPPALTTVAVARARPDYFVYDQFAEVDVRCAVNVEELGRLLVRLDSQTRVRLRVTNLPAAPDVHPRIVIGHPGDAALVATSPPRVVTLPRPSLLALTEEFGLLPIRVLLGRTLPERHSLAELVPREAQGYRPPNVFVSRAPDGRFRLRSREPQLAIALDGTAFPLNEWVLLDDGARFTVRGVEWTFVADVARQG